MSSIATIDRTVQKADIWLKELREELHTDDPQFAYQALRSVLHSLRDRLPVDEATDLGAQLPVLVRGIYYEGWKPAGKPQKIRSREEFLQQISSGLVSAGPNDPARIAAAVFSVLERHVSDGEIEDVRHNLPEELRHLWKR